MSFYSIRFLGLWRPYISSVPFHQHLHTMEPTDSQHASSTLSQQADTTKDIKATLVDALNRNIQYKHLSKAQRVAIATEEELIVLDAGKYTFLRALCSFIELYEESKLPRYPDIYICINLLENVNDKSWNDENRFRND